jgi:hypothetical protein
MDEDEIELFETEFNVIFKIKNEKDAIDDCVSFLENLMGMFHTTIDEDVDLIENMNLSDLDNYDYLVCVLYRKSQKDIIRNNIFLLKNIL